VVVGRIEETEVVDVPAHSLDPNSVCYSYTAPKLQWVGWERFDLTFLIKIELVLQFG